MSVTRIGSTQQFADNWDAAFGKKKAKRKAAANKKAAKKARKKKTKAKVTQKSLF